MLSTMIVGWVDVCRRIKSLHPCDTSMVNKKKDNIIIEESTYGVRVVSMLSIGDFTSFDIA